MYQYLIKFHHFSTDSSFAYLKNTFDVTIHDLIIVQSSAKGNGIFYDRSAHTGFDKYLLRCKSYIPESDQIMISLNIGAMTPIFINGHGNIDETAKKGYEVYLKVVGRDGRLFF